MIENAPARTVEVTLDARARLGECPRWHREEHMLYWVDIPRNALLRFDPATGREDSRIFGAPVGCFAFVAGGGLLLGMKDGFALLRHWDAEPEAFGDQFLAGRGDLRLNDGRVDSEGRFWAGTVNTAKSARDAALYRLDGRGRLKLIDNDMLTCNGAAFSRDGRHFHHADTPSHRLRRYDVNPASGTLSNCRTLHDFPLGEGRPDGGSFDEDGFYWSALFDGGQVVRLSPSGTIVEAVTLPVTRPTMIAFGGEDRRTAFITSAREGLTEAQLVAEPLAGAIFCFQVDVPGVAETDFVLR